MALFGRRGGIRSCPLFGVKQTSSRWPVTSEFDPKATSAIARATTAQSSRACRALAGTYDGGWNLRRRLLNLALLEALECGSLVPRWKQTIGGTATWTHRGGTCF